MMGRRQAWATGAMLLTVACGGSDTPPPESPAQDTTAAMTAAMQQMQGALDEAAGTPARDLPLVSAETLQDRLPTEVNGMARVETDRTQGGAMGINIATASARYEDAAARQLSITITDAGKAGLLAALGAAWANVSIDRVTGDGYERTVTIEGNRGFERERQTPDGAERELSVIVGNRLLVQLDAANVEMAVLRQTLGRLRVQSLLSAP